MKKLIFLAMVAAVSIGCGGQVENLPVAEPNPAFEQDPSAMKEGYEAAKKK